jgi:hypothetical protein
VHLLTDDELLGSDDPEAFGAFYDRNVDALTEWFARRTFDPDEAADLTAETFASALMARRAGPWLRAIAEQRLADYQRTGVVGDRRRRALGLGRRPTRDDLVAAGEREQRRGAISRLGRSLRLRRGRVLIGAAAAIVAVLAGLRADGPATAEIVRTVYVGGHPRDAAAAGGRLVIADQDGGVAVFAPGEPETRVELRVRGVPLSLAAEGGAVWVVTQAATIPRGTRVTEQAGPALTHLVRIDPRGGRVLGRVPVRDVDDAVRAGAPGVRLPAYLGRVSRLEGELPPGARIPVRYEEELVLGTGSAWVRRGDAVYEFDAAGRPLSRARGLAPALSLPSQRSILPDARGAWVVGQAGGGLQRVERGRVLWRVDVGDAAGVVARAGHTVWVSATRRPGSFELVGVDAEHGEVTARVRLGRSAPEAIVPVGRRLWVVTSGGEALLVSPDG